VHLQKTFADGLNPAKAEESKKTVKIIQIERDEVKDNPFKIAATRTIVRMAEQE
jgi:hypothetical protein